LTEVFSFLVFLTLVIANCELPNEEGFESVSDDCVDQANEQDEPVVRRIAWLLYWTAVVFVRVAFSTELEVLEDGKHEWVTGWDPEEQKCHYVSPDN
jgi:hypothetical protein